MNSKTLMSVGSVMMIVSLFMPIATISAGIFSRSMNGYESDLAFSGIIGVALLLVALSKKETPGKRYAPWAAILAGIAIFIVFSLFLKLAGLTSGSDVSSSIGMALPICGIGSLLALVASLTTAPNLDDEEEEYEDEDKQEEDDVEEDEEFSDTSSTDGALEMVIQKIDRVNLKKTPKEYLKRGMEFVEKGEFNDAILEFAKVIRTSSPKEEYYQSAKKTLKEMGFSESDIKQI